MDSDEFDDDLYGGFGCDDDDGFGGGFFGTKGGPTPGTQMGSRLMTAQQQGGVEARPMTSMNGAGYNSSAVERGSSGGFDPLNQSNRASAPPLAEKSEGSPEERAKEIERAVNRLLEQSADAATKKQVMAALDKAKDAAKKEKYLCKYRDQHDLSEQLNFELSLSVAFNLANAYNLNGMHSDALKAYNSIIKNKQFPQAGRMRVNMGNIHFQQKSYSRAIKMYRMALDLIPNTNREMRFKIMRNIAICFIKTGHFEDAVENLAAVMEGAPDFQSGLNLVICHFALGDADEMRKSFSKLVDIRVRGKAGDEDDFDHSAVDDEEDEFITESKKGIGLENTGLASSNLGGGMEEKNREGGGDDENSPNLNLRKNNSIDVLREELKRREKKARSAILSAARLIAPILNRKTWVAGFDWVVETLKESVHPQLASEVEIFKAIEYLKRKQFDLAIEVLKAFEKQDQHLKAKAATNLSFLYFLEEEFANASRYANLAVRNDRYNAKALVNKGNCLFVKGDLEKSRELYLEAIGVEADCSEAIFNLGLVNKKMSNLEESLQAFEKLHSIIPNSPEVIFQIANLHEMMMSFKNAAKWFNILISRVPTDSQVLARMGQLCNKEEDETQALHFHNESFRYYPVNIDVISWLGIWYVRNELYEKAIDFFEQAARIRPSEVKWKLMVASCHRRMAAYQKALDLYEQIHKEYPDNVECLRYLVALCRDMGRPYEEFQAELSKLERNVGMYTNANTRAPGAGQLTQAAAPRGGVPSSIPSSSRSKPRKKNLGSLDEGNGQDEDEDARHSDNEESKVNPEIHHSVGEHGTTIKPKKNEDEDDWADADLDDLLAE